MLGHPRVPGGPVTGQQGTDSANGADDAGDALLPVPRFDWERLVKRLPMAMDLKGFALLLATWADPDGTRVRPGEDRLVAVTGWSKSTIARRTRQLRELGLLEVTRRGGGRGGAGSATVYRLAARPDVLATPGLLPPDEMPSHRAPATDSPVTQVTAQSPVDKDDPRSVDNPESPVIQVTGQSEPVEPIEMSDQGLAGGMRCQIRPIEMSPGRRTTNHTNHLTPPTNGLLSTETTDRANAFGVDNPDFDDGFGDGLATPADAAGPPEDRCSHRLRRALRDDGQPTCALCRRDRRSVSA